MLIPHRNRREGLSHAAYIILLEGVIHSIRMVNISDQIPPNVDYCKSQTPYEVHLQAQKFLWYFSSLDSYDGGAQQQVG